MLKSKIQLFSEVVKKKSEEYELCLTVKPYELNCKLLDATLTERRMLKGGQKKQTMQGIRAISEFSYFSYMAFNDVVLTIAAFYDVNPADIAWIDERDYQTVLEDNEGDA